MPHTPGPWNVCETGYAVYYVNPKIEAGDESIEDDSHDSIVADTQNMGYLSGIPDEDRLANARLIAAAPDLLAALIKMVDSMTDQEWGTHGHAMADREARAAIAKAQFKI